MGGDPATPWAREPVAAVLGDVRADRWNLDDLMAEWLRVITGQRGVEVPAGVGPQLNNRIWRQVGAGALRVAGLTALLLT